MRQPLGGVLHVWHVWHLLHVQRCLFFLYSSMLNMLFSVQEVFEKWLTLIGLRNVQRTKKKTLLVKSPKHFGSPPVVSANMWYDLTVTDIPFAALNNKEKSEKGLKFHESTLCYLDLPPKCGTVWKHVPDQQKMFRESCFRI